MRQAFTITTRFPGMNDLIAANRIRRGNWSKGQEMKQTWQEVARLAIKLHGLKPIRSRCRIQYTFFEPNRRRDMDNISGFAHKVIQDALVAEGILANDGWNEISGYTDSFEVDKDNPRIEVTLIYTGAEK